MPPGTYAEWLKCFEKFSNGCFGKSEAKILEAGSADFSISMLQQFDRELVVFINMLLKKSVDKFTVRVNQLLEQADTFSVLLLLERLLNDLETVAFYTRLKFLETAQKQAITNQIKTALAAFFSDMILQFSNLQDPGLDSVLYYIKRIDRWIKKNDWSADGKLRRN